MDRVVSFDKATGKHISSQTCSLANSPKVILVETQNCINAGYTADQVEVRFVDKAEWDANNENWTQTAEEQADAAVNNIVSGLLEKEKSKSAAKEAIKDVSLDQAVKDKLQEIIDS